VVRACAYHLLNMLNMLRDVLKTLGSSDLEATLAKCQLDTPIEEVSRVGMATEGASVHAREV
jgi:hypothetical protein